jgi:tetratricopeptide (TPR) repeat protein
MKRLLIVLTFTTYSFFANAQVSQEWGGSVGDSVRCWENYNIFGSLYQSNSFAEAYESWKVVYDICPAAKKNTFILAPRVLNAKIAEAKDNPEELKFYVDLLLESFDRRLEYFPENYGYVLGMKGVELMKHYRDEPLTYYQVFQEALKYDDSELTNPQVINGLFLSATRLLKSKDIEIEEFFNVYNIVSESIERNNNQINRQISEIYGRVTRPDPQGGEEADPIVDTASLSDGDQKNLYRLSKTLEGYDIVERNVEIAIGPLLSCERLLRIYDQESFEKNKSDAVWLRRAGNMLAKERKNDDGETEDCTDDPMYFAIAEALYMLEPSAGAARGMGRMSFKKNDFNKGIEYYKQAGELEADPKKRSGDFLKIAIAYQKLNNLPQARAYAQKAINNRPDWGDPYIVLATVYADAAGSCGENVFEKNAVYWLAISKLNAAKSVDESAARRANALIANYKNRLPDKGISFQFGWKEGDTFKIGCWINETITVKF